MLQLEQVVAGYGRTTVLHDISMAIGEGEVVALLGRNGMGKTTSIRSMTGLHRIRSGTIRFRDKDVSKAAPEEISTLGIALVPEGRHIFPTLTVHENLTMAQRPGYWDLNRVHAMFPVLPKRRDHMGHQLSGGEQQMVSIGRALLRNPQMIILDEATEGLAPLVQEQIWSCLHTVSETGIAILIVDKNISAIQKIATRHYIIQKGEIKWAGSNAEFIENENELMTYLAL